MLRVDIYEVEDMKLFFENYLIFEIVNCFVQPKFNFQGLEFLFYFSAGFSDLFFWLFGLFD